MPPSTAGGTPAATRSQRLGRNVAAKLRWMEAFEETRRKAVPQARARGIYTDEDVFKIVS